MTAQKTSAGSYWSESLKLVGKLLSIWFFVSFGCGILFKDYLDQFSLGGAPLGFWMAQQGTTLGFIGIISVYVWVMGRLDKRYREAIQECEPR